MIGRISPVVPSTEKVGRWMLTFDEYAIIEKADVWKDWRNPVRYTTLAELGISLAEIKFRPMPKKTMEAEAISVNAGAKVHQQAGVKMHQSGRGWFEFRQEEREGDFPPRPFEELPAFERVSRWVLSGFGRLRIVCDMLPAVFEPKAVAVHL